MRIGDLVKLRGSTWIGILIEFYTLYDKYGDPYEKQAIVNWGPNYPEEHEHLDDIEVINESR